MILRWAIKWRKDSRLDGKVEYFMWNGTQPFLFRTRREAREHIEAHYGYIRERKDLRDEPHGWKMPQAVRVDVQLVPVDDAYCPICGRGRRAQYHNAENFALDAIEGRE